MPYFWPKISWNALFNACFSKISWFYIKIKKVIQFSIIKFSVYQQNSNINVQNWFQKYAKKKIVSSRPLKKIAVYFYWKMKEIFWFSKIEKIMPTNSAHLWLKMTICYQAQPVQFHMRKNFFRWFIILQLVNGTDLVLITFCNMLSFRRKKV